MSDNRFPGVYVEEVSATIVPIEGVPTRDGTEPEWKYVKLRRVIEHLEHSLQAGLDWVVFEPDDEKLWERVRQSVANFLMTEFESGTLVGATPADAFFVRCDRTTMTQDDIEEGRLVCLVGVALVKPAEFDLLRICRLTAAA